MASSSSSSLSPRNINKYDVFLSFRGEDTPDNFTSHLYYALSQKSIQTFIDDQLNRGDEISQSLVYAIETSAISLIIFSEGYASSRWCLDELVEILQCKREYAQIVIPVFYRVDPSDVRNQTGPFGDSFSKLEERFKENSEKLKSWRNALKEAASFSGFDSQNFSRHAFRQNYPDVGYEELSRKVMEYAQGVPLALKVLGCFLFEREKEVWEDAINKLRRILHPSIQEGIEKIEGICLDMSKVKEIHINSNTFTKMCRLRFLKFYSSIEGENKCKVSDFQGPGFAEVRYLHWHRYPLKSLPSNIQPEKLVLLEMPHSNIQQLWDGVQACISLYIYSCFSDNVITMIIHANIFLCLFFREQHHGKLKQIISVVCNIFTNTPKPLLIPHLDMLVILNLSGCSKLKRLPDISSAGNMQKIFLNGTAIEELPSSIECLRGLLGLYLED
ncbi:hypothetical protein WN944_015391 [Citrus x changshan-huyou]|uniref:TIR domain-containing protein n=1 Tax=Citrus x changshan-huyou TaxID=2935761 RepID=A0AAP0QMM7_9ROSI